MNIPSLIKGFAAKAAIFLILLAPPLTFLHYFLPRSVIIEVGVPYVKRLDNDDNQVGQVNKNQGPTRDVFFIPTFTPGSETPHVFRNEDTGWSLFPPYFKFNSADINAKASRLTGKVAKLRYYGFRIEFLSIFPNVLSIDAAEIGDSTFPWARTVFGALALGVLGYVYFLLRNVIGRLTGIFSVASFAFALIGKASGLVRKKKDVV
jgi:hypothetical protein